jgi:hypothetical protein
MSLRRLWINWLSPLPIVLDLRIEEVVISNPIGWSLVNIFHLICILVLATMFVEILLEVNVIAVIVLAVCNSSTIVPCWNVSPSWIVNSLLESVHLLF